MDWVGFGSPGWTAAVVTIFFVVVVVSTGVFVVVFPILDVVVVVEDGGFAAIVVVSLDSAILTLLWSKPSFFGALVDAITFGSFSCLLLLCSLSYSAYLSVDVANVVLSPCVTGTDSVRERTHLRKKNVIFFRQILTGLRSITRSSNVLLNS